MTQDRELAIEKRLTSLEITVAELKRVVEQRSAWVWNLLGSASGGILVAVVAWWLKSK